MNLSARRTIRQAQAGDNLPSEMRLLLACCHVNLTAAQQERLRREAEMVGDWDSLVQQARHHFIVPLTHQHLSAYAADLVPPHVLEALNDARRKVTVHNLRVTAELRVLVREFLEPLDVPYLAFKGVTLAQRYYGGVGLRQTRDIDILVPSDRRYEVAYRLMSAGYRLKQADPVPDEKALRYYCGCTAEVNFISPSGVLIELHQLLDFTGCQYPVATDWLLARAEQQAVGGSTYSVFPTTELFVYICYHHARHRWSRLHWVADLSAFINHPSFDREAIIRRARALGLEELVGASLLLHDVLLEGSANMAITGLAKQMIADCQRYLTPGAPPPEHERFQKIVTTLGGWKVRLEKLLWNWRANTHWRNRVSYLRHLTRPTYSDYLFLSLPKQLHGFYPAIRPIRWIYEIAWQTGCRMLSCRRPR